MNFKLFSGSQFLKEIWIYLNAKNKKTRYTPFLEIQAIEFASQLKLLPSIKVYRLRVGFPEGAWQFHQNCRILSSVVIFEIFFPNYQLAFLIDFLFLPIHFVGFYFLARCMLYGVDATDLEDNETSKLFDFIENLWHFDLTRNQTPTDV